MRRPNKATVSEPGLGAAFAEGVNEGFRLTGHVLLICQIGGRDKIRIVTKASKVPDILSDFVAGLRGEHYEVGVTVRIIAEGDVVPEGQASAPTGAAELEEDPIEDAEVIDG